MKLIFLMSLSILATSCENAGKVMTDSVNSLQYSTNSYTAANYVGMTEEELKKKILRFEKEISLGQDKKLAYGRRNDAYLILNGKVDRAYMVSSVAYEVKYNSIGSIKEKSKTIAFVPAGNGNTSQVVFESAVEPIKNLLKFKGYKVVDGSKASIIVHVKYGSEKSLAGNESLDPAFFNVQKQSKDSYLRYLELDARESSKSIWNYKAVSEGMKPAIEPAIAAMAFVGYNDIPKSSIGAKVSSISETDPALDLIGRGNF